MAFAEELRHASASLRIDVEINACERDEDVAGADIILISAGQPRVPGVKMSRRDLAVQNAKTVKYVAEATVSRNPGAKYIVITNPVDAMAMICKRYSKAKFVISTGTNLESLRFRSQLARTLEVQVSKVQGWAGGEHGSAAIILWSSARAYGLPAEEYARSKNKVLDKTEIESYMKTVSKLVVDNIGGTEYGPAASFRDIVRAITKNTDEILSVATPMRFEGIPEPVFVGVPQRLGWSLETTLFETFSEEEKKGLAEAAKAVYQTYQTAVAGIE
jgi:malate dehydrogenase